MCGIAAQVSTRGMVAPRHVLQRLAHRGPDAEGGWTNATGTAWLGHRRLAIVDLSPAGQQPMRNEDQSVWLVCNGEIYNYLRLRKELELAGHHFYSSCDCEVILHAYEQWGDDCVDHLEGMFAFAIWDESNQRLVAARDRIGIKPLFWARHDGGVSLASEAGALLQLMPNRPQVSGIAMAYAMSLGYVPSPWSIWEGIEKLEPGHMLTWSNSGGVEKRCYWQPPEDIDSLDTTGASEFEAIFHDVMSDHLLSDVPIGLFLSGGLDSSSVASCLHELGHRSSALTVTFPSSKESEGPIAKCVAEHLGMPNEQVPLRIGAVADLVRKTVESNDEPQGYSALLSMLMLCEETSKRFKVVFAGDGGDEVFGGYSWYDKPITKKSRSAAAIRALIGKIPIESLPLKARKIAAKSYARLSPLHAHAWRLFPRFLPEEIRWLLSPREVEFDEERAIIPFKRHATPSLPPKRQLQRIDLMNFCTDSILAKVDRASMANSLEVRVPLLDRRIVEFGIARPVEDTEARESKPTLRRYLRPRVPDQVLNHTKQGFSLRIMDQFDWESAIDQVDESSMVQEGHWDPNWKTLVRPGIPFRQGRIWTLLILSQWHEHWKEAA